MKSIRWDKIRILVTDHCNYHCPFCHNEGQEKGGQVEMMPFELYKQLIDCLCDQNISEINFSGGEPFLHKDIVDMITYANDRMACDISCATNLSLITDNQIEHLKRSRIKFNIQFPFVAEKDFAKSTGTGKLGKVLNRIKAVKSAGIMIGLNTVVQSVNIKSIRQMLLFALENELPLKFLPQIGQKDSNQYINDIVPIISEYSVDYTDKGTGALRWIIKNGDHQTSVLYIDSPCFCQDIVTCRNYGEIRIHPNFTLQPCIMKRPIERLCLEKEKDFIIEQFERQWNDFKQC